VRLGLAGPVQTAGLRPWLWGTDGQQVPPGNGGTPVTMLARALLRRGHELVVTTLDPTVTGEVVLEGPRLRVCLGPYRSGRRGRDAYRVERRYLAMALAREAPPFVHAHWSYEYALAALAVGSPTLVTVHDWAPAILRMSPDPYRAVRLGMNTVALARARHFTAPSPYLADRVRRWRRRPVAVVPNALEDEAFSAAPRSRGLRLLAVNDGFTTRKNVGALLRAHRLVRRALPEALLRLAGADHGEDGPAHRWARREGLDDGVVFDGPVPHERVRALMAEADVLVHPSLEESFGMVLVEAMAQGLPVVAGRSSGAVPWVLGGGRGGVLTEVTSPQALARAVLDLLRDGERWRHYSRAGYALADAEFRMERVVERYLAAYRSLLPLAG
jgi:glycosyltransferase involved in cell wall biosynthesis